MRSYLSSEAGSTATCILIPVRFVAALFWRHPG